MNLFIDLPQKSCSVKRRLQKTQSLVVCDRRLCFHDLIFGSVVHCGCSRSTNCRWTIDITTAFGKLCLMLKTWSVRAEPNDRGECPREQSSEVIAGPRILETRRRLLQRNVESAMYSGGGYRCTFALSAICRWSVVDPADFASICHVGCRQWPTTRLVFRQKMPGITGEHWLVVCWRCAGSVFRSCVFCLSVLWLWRRSSVG